MSYLNSSIAEKYNLFLANRNYSEQTIRSYSKCLRDFLLKYDKNPYKLNKSDLSEYLMNYNYSSIEQQNQIISSLKIFYFEILHVKKLDIIGIKRPIRELKLPNIIEENFLLDKLNNISNIKHKAILSLAYCVGLRRSEIQNLKLIHIDSKNMNIKIVQSKGNKDRYVPLTENMLTLLREYFKKYKPCVNLFEGENCNVYSSTSLNNIVKKYFGVKYHFHNLRHSCATHLLNKGVDVCFIQKLLGHANIKTTMKYFNLTTQDLNKLPFSI